MSSPSSNTARTSTPRRRESSHPSSSAVRRWYPSSRLNPGRASALATEPELGAAADEFLDVLKESRAVGLVFVGDELPRRMLPLPFRIELRLSSVHALQPSS